MRRNTLLYCRPTNYALSRCYFTGVQGVGRFRASKPPINPQHQKSSDKNARKSSSRELIQGTVHGGLPNGESALQLYSSTALYTTDPAQPIITVHVIAHRSKIYKS
jgi:hypothetical protein